VVRGVFLKASVTKARVLLAGLALKPESFNSGAAGFASLVRAREAEMHTICRLLWLRFVQIL
jgi:hypothetical protein